MFESALLRGVFHGLAPNVCVIQILQQALVNLHNGRLHCDAVTTLSQDQWVLEIWCLTLLAGVDSNETERVPDLFEEDVTSLGSCH